MTLMPTQLFKDWFFDKFRDWENQQPGRRSTYTAFAAWLSDNSFGVNFNQALVSYWIKGVIPTNEKYIWALAEKLGDTIYQILDVPKPDTDLLFVQNSWDGLPSGFRRSITDQIQRYIKDNVQQPKPKNSEKRRN